MRFRFALTLLISIVLASGLVCLSQAAEYDVNWDGTGDFEAIQDAIDASSHGDVIVVHPGTYYENIHFDGKNVTLRSLDPQDEQIVASTVIDGAQKASVVTFAGTEDETCLLSGFTITNGSGAGILSVYASGYTRAGISNCTISGNSGRGLNSCSGTISNCTISGNLGYDGVGLSGCTTVSNCTVSNNTGGGLSGCTTVSNCTISGNSTTGSGGGLSGCTTVSNCTISSNSAAQAGGGLAGCYGGTISNCTIYDNSAGTTGGGLDSCSGFFGNWTISNCTIYDNSAGSSGGGLAYCTGGMGYLTITNCTITGNSAIEYGGGLDHCDATITNCTISGNSCETRDGGGLDACNGTITNCTISGNSAAGAHADGGGLAYCTGPISNCTISGNSAGWCGGGLGGCTGTIINCVVWANQAGQEGNELYGCEAAVVTYSCIQAWTGGGEGNISHDPLFVTGPLGDYYLSCTAAGQNTDSPCIDSGSASAESLGLDRLTTRTDRVPDAGQVDMGYHYPLTLPQNPQILCSLNASEFSPGDLLIGSIEAHNPGADVTVDAYIAFVLPNGTIVTLTSGGLAVGTHPWVSNVVLPSGFDFGPYEVLRTTVPRSPGGYLFAAALTVPGRLEFIGQPSLYPFTISE